MHNEEGSRGRKASIILFFILLTHMHGFITFMQCILINEATKIFSGYIDELPNVSKSIRDLISKVQHALTLKVWSKHC